MHSHHYQAQQLPTAQQHLQPYQQSGSSSGGDMIQPHNHQRPIVGQYLAQQTSFSSSEEEYDGEFYNFSMFHCVFFFWKKSYMQYATSYNNCIFSFKQNDLFD